MRTKLIAGNWKMHGSKPEIRSLIGGILARLDPNRTAEVMVLPPFPYLPLVDSLVDATPVVLGAQDLSAHASGAYTGEVSGAMLADWNCSYVLVGHSERRALHDESNDVVAGKFVAAQDAGLQPILCVGETLEEREAGRTREVIGQQIASVIETAGIQAFARAVVAYEPVWAIGTGQTASPEQAQEVHAAIRAQFAEEDATIAGRIRILYGGSVKPDNAADLFTCEDIDGGLIGGASLQAETFMAIYQAA
ncbi:MULTISPECIES: triose-phosphate isomerase [unclassified Wenzhouxiangella]|uniref:triose-phosphate isomerase n=1 Tax=unclassified Wenzhouxiangella TaxID=2613841 RepID=UPI000E325629|nr:MULTISPECIES: triose-phosphate isomerase [unclassified Wenzhouxiangella]RFF28435.1 triose-phosphate isomerase [Wenzhouxiangella sp. 15181]RFP69952.1 triose-phosphate isomerase [Wenzhouxiangella sp. 15190]